MYLGWLPVTYNMELNFCKTVFKALDNEDWPPYLRLEVRELAEFKLNLAVPKHSGAFQDSTTPFNNPPKTIKTCTARANFVRKCKEI